MKDFMKTKLFLVSLFFLFLGVLFIALENIFYGNIDENGVLQESFYLPLGSISFIVGAVGLIASIVWRLIRGRNT